MAQAEGLLPSARWWTLSTMRWWRKARMSPRHPKDGWGSRCPEQLSNFVLKLPRRAPRALRR